MDYHNNTWKVIDSYFNGNNNYLTKHHLDSYNDFFINKIPQTLKQYNPQIHYKEYNKEGDFYKYFKQFDEANNSYDKALEEETDEGKVNFIRLKKVYSND